MDLTEEVERLRKRFLALADGGKDEMPGASELAAGLEKVTGHLDGDGSADGGGRVAVIVQGLKGLADYLESADGGDEEKKDGFDAHDAPTRATGGLDQFVETFRKEAQKRIQGLSIAMMGIFGDEVNSAAIAQSADHLHAIRGGAAMLGIDGVAELSAAMEKLIKANGRLEPEERQWPTKTLLRGYAVLEQAVVNKPLKVDRERSDEVVERLTEATARLRPDQPGAQPAAEVSEKSDVSRETQADDQPADEGESKDGDLAYDINLEQPILVVDDVETIAASVAFILAELDVPIEIATHGEEAMKMLQEKPFSLVISDVDMPRMDGIALTRMIRDTEELKQLPVILLTSLDHPEERKAGIEAGATDYLIKGSIGGGELMGRVRELLEVAPVVERDERPEKRRILVAEDTETVAASIAFVLSEGPYEITLATDGKDARRKLDANSFDLVITDMQMPYMSGNELVESIRDDDEHAGMPIVMLTSVQDDDLIDEARQAGVDRYLIKGEIAGGKLLTIVDELLEG